MSTIQLFISMVQPYPQDYNPDVYHYASINMSEYNPNEVVSLILSNVLSRPIMILDVPKFIVMQYTICKPCDNEQMWDLFHQAWANTRHDLPLAKMNYFIWRLEFSFEGLCFW